MTLSLSLGSDYLELEVNQVLIAGKPVDVKERLMTIMNTISFLSSLEKARLRSVVSSRSNRSAFPSDLTASSPRHLLGTSSPAAHNDVSILAPLHCQCRI